MSSTALTTEQLAWENDWLDRLMAAADALDVEKWVRPFYAEDAEWIYGNFPVIKGAQAIEESLRQTLTLLSSMKHINFVRSFNHASNTIYQQADIIYVVAGDDEEKKEITIPGAIVIQKPLGVKEEKQTKAQVYLDISPLFQRIAELEAGKKEQ